MTLYTGDAFDGVAGDIELAVGHSVTSDRRTLHHGGNVRVTAGESKDKTMTGGAVLVAAGLGSSDDETDGGSGGAVTVRGGRAEGGSVALNPGGNVN
eukprot:2474976-Pyramimonas_sp.AAC.1